MHRTFQCTLEIVPEVIHKILHAYFNISPHNFPPQGDMPGPRILQQSPAMTIASGGMIGGIAPLLTPTFRANRTFPGIV